MPTNEFGLYTPTRDGRRIFIGPFTDVGYTTKYYNPADIQFVEEAAAAAALASDPPITLDEDSGIAPVSIASSAVVIGDGSLAALRTELMARDLPVPDEIKTTEMLAAEVRAERDGRLFEYDAYVAYLQRELRKTTDAQRIADINATIEVLDAWAVELCNLPQQAGFPWTGVATAPWPAYPPVLKITTVEIEKKK